MSPSRSSPPYGPSGPSEGTEGRGREELRYRGIRWRRTASGKVSWYNAGLVRWVNWAPGADAPPLPPGWEEQANGAATFPRAATPVQRRSMKSPYRVIPVLIAIGVVGVALWQANLPPAPATAADIQAARALAGDCLATSGGTPKFPDFSPTPVSCSSAQAAVRVVKVVDKAGSCPPKTVFVLQVILPGVTNEPFECANPVTSS